MTALVTELTRAEEELAKAAKDFAKDEEQPLAQKCQRLWNVRIEAIKGDLEGARQDARVLFVRACVLRAGGHEAPECTEEKKAEFKLSAKTLGRETADEIVNPRAAGDATVSGPVADLLALTTKIAIKRAKQRGLGLLAKRLRTAVCGLEQPTKTDEENEAEKRAAEKKAAAEKAAEEKAAEEKAAKKKAAEEKVTEEKAAKENVAKAATSDEKSGETIPAALAHAPEERPDLAGLAEGQKVFPATCRLLTDVSLEELASDPRRLQPALTEDLVGVIGRAAWQSLESDVPKTIKDLIAPTAKLTLELVLQARKHQDATPSADEARALVNQLLRTRCSIGSAGCKTGWGKALAVPLALESIAEFSVRKGQDDIATVVRDLAGEGASTDLVVRATRIAAHGVRAVGFDNAATENRERWMAAISFAFEVVAEATLTNITVVETRTVAEKIARTRDLLEAVADENIPAAVSAGAQLLITLLPDPKKCERPSDNDARTQRNAVKDRCALPHALKQATVLLTGVASYAITYSPTEVDGKTRAELLESRQAALEGMIDGATRRGHRHGNWVASVGMPIGFDVVGVQWVRRSGKFSDEVSPPQLAIPMGFAVQRLPGSRYARGLAKEKRGDASFRFDGFHTFVSVLDLGQFVAYDLNGDLNRPRWDTVFSPGLQLAWAIGTPDNTFVIGPEFRYAPTLFSGTTKIVPDQDSQGGALRLGLVLAYYVPFFDFN